jgi:rubredoxin
MRSLARSLDQVVDLPYIPPVECHPPISLGYNTESQITLPMEDALSSSFVLPPAHPAPHSFGFVTRSTRSFSRRNTSAVLHDLDEYAEGNSSAEETDDEYVPPPSLNPRKRHRSSRNISAPTVGGDPYVSARAKKRPRPAPLPRNVQAVPGTVTSPATKLNPWACPHCAWVQRNHRTPDLKRHIRTHTRFERPAQWVCCGIPFESATVYNVPHDATPYFRDGKQWIGGCGKEFSRRDALKRHLGNDHISCIGDIDAFANTFDD